MHRRNLLIVVIVVPGCLLACAAQDRTGQGKRFAEVIQRIEKEYFRAIDSEQLFQAAMEGVFRELDDRSKFIEPSKLKNYERDFKKEFAGIGVELDSELSSGRHCCCCSRVWRACLAGWYPIWGSYSQR